MIDFHYKAADSYDFGTRGQVLLFISIQKQKQKQKQTNKNVPVALHLTSQLSVYDITQNCFLQIFAENMLILKFSPKIPGNMRVC